MIEISCAMVLQNMHDFLAIMQDHSQANRQFGNPANQIQSGESWGIHWYSRFMYL